MTAAEILAKTVSWMNAHAGLLQINALDAAMPFDFESRATSRMKESKQLTVGIVGFGTFGQFLAKRLVQAGHKVSLCILHGQRVPAARDHLKIRLHLWTDTGCIVLSIGLGNVLFLWRCSDSASEGVVTASNLQACKS